MRNILLVVLFSMVSLVGCEISFNYEDIYSSQLSDHNLFYDTSFSDIDNEGCIGRWLNINMNFILDNEDNEKWLDPNISFYRGFGDCTDFSLVYLNIAYMEFNEKYSLIFVNQSDLKDMNPENFDHVMVVENGYVTSAQLGMRYAQLENIRPNGEYVFSFDEIFNY